MADELLWFIEYRLVLIWPRQVPLCQEQRLRVGQLNYFTHIFSDEYV